MHGTKLHLEGYLYVKKRDLADGRISWQCEKQQSEACSRAISTNGPPPPPPNYAGANDTETSTNQKVEITHKLHITKIDQKVFNALTDIKSSRSCYVCGATPKQFNNLSSFPHPKNDTYKYGISPIHNWICCFEMLIHISYRIEVQKWWISAEDEEQFFLVMYPSLMHIVRIQMVALNDSMQSLSDYLVRPTNKWHIYKMNSSLENKPLS